MAPVLLIGRVIVSWNWVAASNLPLWTTAIPDTPLFLKAGRAQNRLTLLADARPGLELQKLILPQGELT